MPDPNSNVMTSGWMIMGMRHDENTVMLIASNEVRRPELTEDIDRYDQMIAVAGVVTQLPVRDITLIVSLDGYIVITAGSFGEAMTRLLEQAGAPCD